MNPAPPNITSGKILVIDDNPIIQRSMYFALRDRGYTVLMSGEISEALKIRRRERLDAILLDLNFPPNASAGANAMGNGFWALDWMQPMDEIKDIPVIIISIDPPGKSKAHAMACGAAAYFHKPIDKYELVATLEELLANKLAPKA